MSKKHMSLWLKWGIIISVSLSFITLFPLFLQMELSLFSIDNYPLIAKLYLLNPAIIPSLIGCGFRQGVSCPDLYAWALMLILSLVVFFLIGAIIGWIVGKIKSK